MLEQHKLTVEDRASQAVGMEQCANPAVVAEVDSFESPLEALEAALSGEPEQFSHYTEDAFDADLVVAAIETSRLEDESECMVISNEFGTFYANVRFLGNEL